MNMQWMWACLGRAIEVSAIIAFCVLPVAGDEVRPSSLDVPYEPTHAQIVDVMLKLAEVTSSDYVVDLGCGDGRIVIAAAKEFGARGLGIDLDGQRIRESIDNAAYAGVSGLVQFRQANIMDVPIHDANVVTMYLLDEVNLMVRPKLFRELRPGTRVVSHAFHMDDWRSDRVVHHPRARNNAVHLWIMPARVSGTWEWTASTPQGEIRVVLRMGQEFQTLAGAAHLPELNLVRPVSASISGRQLALMFDAEIRGQKMRLRCEGVVEGDEVHGIQADLEHPSSGTRPWTAKRQPADPSGTWQIDVPACPSLNGTVYIGRSGDITNAKYLRNDSMPDDAFYFWGRSIRIDSTKDQDKVVFRGSLDARTGTGTIYRQNWLQEPQWSATKVSDEVPASVSLVASHETAPVPAPATATQAGHEEKSPEPNGTSSTPARLVPVVQQRQWTPKLGDPRPGDEYVNPTDGSVLIWIPGGEFTMGSDDGQGDERPTHKVTVAGFWLGKYEVTNEQYRKFLKSQGGLRTYYADDPNYGDPNQPVVGAILLHQLVVGAPLSHLAVLYHQQVVGVLERG